MTRLLSKPAAANGDPPLYQQVKDYIVGRILAGDWPEGARAMANPLVVDGRNFLDAEAVRAAGFTYEGIGRATNGNGGSAAG